MATNETLRHSPEPASRVSFEYTGNFSQRIGINQTALAALFETTGMPRRQLVIQTGNERVEGFQMGLFMRRGWPGIGILAERKPFRSLEISDDNAVLTIHSQVIDGRLQKQQRRENLTYRDYEERFIQILTESIQWGIEKWLVEEISSQSRGKRFIERSMQMGAFIRLWKEMKDQIVSLPGQKTEPES